MHTWTSLRAHNQAYVHKQDYAYVSSCLENPKNTTDATKLKNEKYSILTCILNIQKRKPTLDKHIITRK